ncbi:uncharacterized protein METZ01_LOCUS487743, partial [marine metagenome]
IKFTTSKFEWDTNNVQALDYVDIPQGVWMHHVVVKQGTEITYYRDGVQSGSHTIVAAPQDPQPLYFGGQGVENWAGYMSDIRLFNTALDEDEVLTVFDNRGVFKDTSILLFADFIEDDGGFTETSDGNSPIPSIHTDGEPGAWSMQGDDSGPATNYITSPLIEIPITAGIEVSFNHRYSIEAEWDGTVVEYAIDRGPFTIIPKDLFTKNGYNFSNLLGNHVIQAGDGFNGNSEGYFEGA